MTRPAPQSKVRPIVSVAEAQQIISHLNDVMDALLSIVEQETADVRAGRLSDVARLEPAKADLARLYLTDIERLKASNAFLTEAMPDDIAKLRHRHDSFHAQLQINLTVLATAHAVSEGIVRGLSAEIARKNTPQTYGATGQNSAPNVRAAAPPLALSRTL